MIRPRSKERAVRFAAVVAGDFLIACGALVAVVYLRRHVPVSFTRGLLPAANFVVDAPNVLLFALSLLAALALSGFYSNRMTPRTRSSFAAVAVIQIALLAVGAAALERPLPRTILLGVVVAELVGVRVWRVLLRAVVPIRPRATLLVGEPDAIDSALAGFHLTGDERIRVVGRIAFSADSARDDETLRRLRDAQEVIFVSRGADARARLELLRIRGARGFLMVASHVDALLGVPLLGWIGDQPLVEVTVACGYGINAAVKRAVDVLGATLLAIVTAPLWIAISVAVLIDDGLPIVIRQQRVGWKGVPYGMFKFRSMTDDGVTRVGALLRRYHLDELPQLLNVLSGEMSLVGPRPERPELAETILRDVPDFDLRCLVRPGIAGLAQVSADYDTHAEIKLSYDLMYMCDWSMLLDLRLLFRAVSSSLSGSGV